LNPHARTLLLVGTAIALILLVLFGELPWSANWAVVLSDAAHGPVSAIMAIILLLLMRQRGWPATVASRWILSIVVTTLLGIAIELVQSVIGRDAELSDVVTDFLGASAGTGWYVLAIRRSHLREHPLLLATGIVTAVMATVMLSIPVLTMAGAYAAKQTRWPVIIDANASFGVYFLTTYWLVADESVLPRRWQTTDEQAGFLVPLNTLTDPHQRWGLSVEEFDPHWQGKQALALDIANPTSKPLRLRLRVFDRDDGLENRSGFITTLTIPANTRMTHRVTTRDMSAGSGTQAINLGHVRGFVIDSPIDDDARDGAQEFFLIKVALE
jgi:hypothetical protein